VAVAAGSLALGGAAVLAFHGPRVARHAPSAVPSAAPAPTAAPVAPTASATAVAATIEVDGVDAAGWRARLDKASQIKDWVLGAKAFLALVQLDPALLDDAGARAQIIAVAAGIAHEGRNELSDAVFDTLTNRLGPRGLDLLYEIALSRGGTRGGQRARALLAQPDVVARETPALRVAYEFFVASCAARRTLLDRAAAEGDRRTLVQMEVAHGARCANKKDPCCFREDAAMADAIAKLRARVGN
jgi:serine/threonine-protein kinase